LVWQQESRTTVLWLGLLVIFYQYDQLKIFVSLAEYSVIGVVGVEQMRMGFYKSFYKQLGNVCLCIQIQKAEYGQ
jgi:hypothetical protein